MKTTFPSPEGEFIGLTNPDVTPAYLNLTTDMTRPPRAFIFGDPGSGDLFRSQQEEEEN
jgi:hypothetical protein